MQSNFTLYIIGVLLLFTSCKNTVGKETVPSETDYSKGSYDISWINGNWIDSTKFGFKKLHYFENWKKISSTNYSCSKFTSKNGIKNEGSEINLVKNNNKFYYSFDYKNEQITYYSDSLSDNYIRLISPIDKFPQTIEYKRIEDTLFISQSGMVGGVFRNPIYKALKY